MNAKTLFAALAATSMLTVFGDFTNAVNFEGYTEGATLTNGNNDNGTDTGVNNAYFLYQGDEDNSVVTNTLGSYTSENGVPKDGLQTKSLYVDTSSGTLFRSVKHITDASTLGATFDLSSDGDLFVDTLVQFTVTEDEEPQTESTDKLAIWLSTNNTLYVKAGYLNKEGESPISGENDTVYALSGLVEPGTWYRLTVQATYGIGGTSYPGFKIYIDGEAVHATTATANAEAEGIDASKMQDESGNWVVFPSLKNTSLLQAVGFKGTGAVDDLVITDGLPNFLINEVDFTLTWDANVTAITILIGNNGYDGEETVISEVTDPGTAGSKTFTVNAGTKIGIYYDQVTAGELTPAWTNSATITAEAETDEDLDSGTTFTIGYLYTVTDAGVVALIYEGGSSGDEDWVPDSSTIAEGTSAADQYSSLADSALATADAKKLTDWATNNDIDFDAIKNDTTGDYVDAYLLNCTLAEVDDEKEEFKGNINISFDEDGKPVITLREGSENQYNGTLKTMGATVLSNDPDDWTEVDGDAEDYTFFKFELSL